MSDKSTTMSVRHFIADRIEASGKTQCQIAQECGFENPNMITLIKQGSTKLPMNRIGPLAKALDCDPAHLLRVTMLEYVPDTWAAIEDALKSTLLTANELALIRAYRAASGDSDAVATIVDRGSMLAVVAAQTTNTH